MRWHKFKAQSNTTITVYPDRSTLALPLLPYSLWILECDVEAAIGSPFIPLSHARNAQHEEVHYLYTFPSPPPLPLCTAQKRTSRNNMENLTSVQPC